MTTSCLSRCLCIGFVSLVGACTPSVEPAFNTEQRYKHDLYSPEDCLRISQSNAEFSCSETVQFNADGTANLFLGGGDNGTANLFLGGGDIGVRGNYQRKGQKITVQPSASLREAVVFRVVSDSELIRVAGNTRWFPY